MRLSRPQARRIALAAQLVGRPKPVSATGREVSRVIARLAQFQIDSVNVVARAHLMPLFSRLGPYDPELLRRAAERAPRRLFEYWGHAASLMDTALLPAMRHRMNRHWDWPGLDQLNRERPGFVEDVHARVAERGPVTARELAPPGSGGAGAWWGWSETKSVLEWLLATGKLGVADRTPAFERRYDLLERVLPQAGADGLDTAEAHLVLVRRAAEALGVASRRCLADYFRTGRQPTDAAIASLERSGELIAAQVEGWPEPVWVWHKAARPRSVEACAIVSPFDSLVFERRRLAALFDVDYRIEIYVPAAKRVYGYYVYLFVCGDEIAARADLKADRATGRLIVHSAWLEPGTSQPAERVASGLDAQLGELAAWLGLGEIEYRDRGSLAPVLRGLAR
ncbi:MAG: crosslink repair DNA glycosylase YcaQ family protein [Propionibacteriaceae bacterium]|nr:crosslink repair DNA glycosylase YcaQ family protein [Propionibacteriaceae bacterium]